MRLTLSELSADRSGRPLFRGLCAEVSAGQCLKLAGPNGAGKTSLLRIIAGFLLPTHGCVTLTTENGIFCDAESRGTAIGWMGSEDAIRPHGSVLSQLQFYAGLYAPCGGAKNTTKIMDILQTCGLTAQAHRPGGQLSAGQRRRFALARLMVVARPLWLMDEPLALLDSDGRETIRAAMAAHCADGGIIVTAGHDAMDLAGPRLFFEAG